MLCPSSTVSHMSLEVRSFDSTRWTWQLRICWNRSVFRRRPPDRCGRSHQRILPDIPSETHPPKDRRRHRTRRQVRAPRVPLLRPVLKNQCLGRCSRDSAESVSAPTQASRAPGSCYWCGARPAATTLVRFSRTAFHSRQAHGTPCDAWNAKHRCRREPVNNRRED